MTEWTALLKPQHGILCLNCLKMIRSQHPDLPRLPAEAYTTQTPKKIIIKHSQEGIQFRGTYFYQTTSYIQTICSVCEEENLYPLQHWEEKLVLKNIEEEKERLKNG